jgi:hypothetical protein
MNDLGRRYWLGLPLPSYVLFIAGGIAAVAGVLAHWDFLAGAGVGLLFVGLVQTIGTALRNRAAR